MKRRRLGPRDAALVLGAVGAAAVLVLLLSPVHRAFYLGQGGRGRSAAEKLTGALAIPALPVAGRARAPVASAAVASGRRLLRADATGRLQVPLADEVPWRLPFAGAPPGWTVREFSGRADVELVRAEDGLALRLQSDASSFVLYRDLVLDLQALPRLVWTWKVTRLPARGDVRRAATDDQAAQLYVIFPRWPSPRTRSDVVGYIWDTTTPAGTRLASPRAPNVRVIVVESGAGALGRWQRYERNVLEDYRTLFGREAPRVGGLALMIDADDTRGQAEALVGGLAFAGPSAGSSKIPTSMLR